MYLVVIYSGIFQISKQVRDNVHEIWEFIDYQWANIIECSSSLSSTQLLDTKYILFIP